jgi:hypothetical protein
MHAASTAAAENQTGSSQSNCITGKLAMTANEIKRGIGWPTEAGRGRWEHTSDYAMKINSERQQVVQVPTVSGEASALRQTAYYCKLTELQQSYRLC